MSSLVAVIDKSVRGMDQRLGYRGRDRFVLFYYEPRGEEVVWRDTRSYGFAHGAWAAFYEELAPVARMYGAAVGGDDDGSPARQVLLVDRQDRRAYFAERDEAMRFLAAVAAGRQDGPCEGGAALPDMPASAASAEVNQETLRRLAYAIWERKGRVEGHYLDDWLEAEALLTAGTRRTSNRQGSPPDSGHTQKNPARSTKTRWPSAPPVPVRGQVVARRANRASGLVPSVVTCPLLPH